MPRPPEVSEMLRVVRALFPETDPIRWNMVEVGHALVPPMKELKRAVEKCSSKKAPGLDGVY